MSRLGFILSVETVEYFGNVERYQRAKKVQNNVQVKHHRSVPEIGLWHRNLLCSMYRSHRRWYICGAIFILAMFVAMLCTCR